MYLRQQTRFWYLSQWPHVNILFYIIPSCIYVFETAQEIWVFITMATCKLFILYHSINYLCILDST